jgi:ElaA protein
MVYALLRLRIEVLVVEQACPYQELDGRDLDDTTRHYWLAPDGAIEDPQATLRLLEFPDGSFRIGRVCVARHARGRGAARRLLEAALAEVGNTPCVLDAQSHLTELYAGFGFRPEPSSSRTAFRTSRCAGTVRPSSRAPCADRSRGRRLRR